jgi:hypothetical protein
MVDLLLRLIVVRAGQELKPLALARHYGTKVPWCQSGFRKMTDQDKKVSRRRVDTEAINLRLPRDMIDAIDDQRRLEPDLPTRPEMIRRALVQWLEMVEGKSEE